MAETIRILTGFIIIAFCFYGSVELALFLFGKDGALGQFVIMMLGLIVGLFMGIQVFLSKRE